MSPEVSPCMCFGTVEDCREWLIRHRKMPRNGWPSDGSQEPIGPGAVVEKAKEVQEADAIKEAIMPERCSCQDIGSDGFRTCSAAPHRHLIHLPRASTPKARNVTMRLCDNHVKGYLAVGWQEVAQRVCQSCCTNEPLEGDSLCEGCAGDMAPTDAERLKTQGQCINRDTVHGCLIWSEKGHPMCTYCLNYFRSSYAPSARIRGIPTSARPCGLTVGCAGTMSASVRRFVPTQKPELWWSCSVCRVTQVAARSQSIPDSRTEAVVHEQLEDLRIASELQQSTGTDMTDMASRIREMLLEADDG